MRFIFLVSISLFFIGQANAAPASYRGNCGVFLDSLKEGQEAPSKEVDLKKGDRVEVYSEGDLHYEVFWGDFFNQENLLQVRILNTATNRQTLSNVYVVNEFPWMIEHVSQFGSIFCMTK